MQNMNNEIKSLINQVEIFEKDENLKAKSKLTENCFFLDENKILCYPSESGSSRYPYSKNGMIMWVYSNGMIAIQESTFNVILPSYESEEPKFSIYSGIKDKNIYDCFSLLSLEKQEINTKRFMIFAETCAYFFVIKNNLCFSTRLFIDNNKQINISVYIYNKDEKEKEIILSTYFDFLLRHDEFENFETKWYKKCLATDNYALTETMEYFGGNNRIHNYALIKKNIENNNYVCLNTSSKNNYVGGFRKSIRECDSIKKGTFNNDVKICSFSEKAVNGDLIKFTIKNGESIRIDYNISFSENINEINNLKENKISFEYIDSMLDDMRLFNNQNAYKKNIDINFNSINNYNGKLFNNFINNVIHQVDFCAKSKNFAGEYLGTRDIFQQVEACLMWDPDYCKIKIVECLNFIGEDGRCPRQFSYPAFKGANPKMDLRNYIDQGLWIILTIYSYLSFTNDFSILDEKCGYYILNNNTINKSDRYDSVLEHIITVIDYLVSNIDDNTNCIKILHGDWNDAIDGLGVNNNGKGFGSGVSVMASLQLYDCVNKMIEILSVKEIYKDKINVYQNSAEKLKQGILSNAILNDDKGNRKIVHGWGDNKCFYVGSFCDNDKKSRDSITSNAFFILCGGLSWDNSLKEDILKAYDRLESKYGIKTFNPAFEEDNYEVGRISCLPQGTAENSATYIHATLFAIWSLFEIKEYERAWKELLKILPFTHEKISTSPFIMSNSYVYNNELNLDGQSMNDWYTGSGCVLMKIIVRCIFGIQPNLNSIIIKPNKFLPTDYAKINIIIKGKKFEIVYHNSRSTNLRVIINNTIFENMDKIVLNNDKLLDENHIEINI